MNKLKSLSARKLVMVAAAAVMLLAVGILIGVSAMNNGNTVISEGNLMNGITAQNVEEREPDERFSLAAGDFATELLRICAKEDDNALVSPLSVLMALSMTANGAGGETLSQMEKVLGNGISAQEMNEYLYTFRKSEGDSLAIANAIWLRDDENVKVNKDFLQTNASYYGAAANKAPFDESTVKKINNWVREKTDGMIDGIVDRFTANDKLALLNAVCFDAKWKKPYKSAEVYEADFTDVNKKKHRTSFMRSEEKLFIEGDNELGFIKPYEKDYSFVALLPNDGISIDQYLESLDGEEFMALVASATDERVSTVLPKFETESRFKLNNALSSMGMPDAFNEKKADFSAMGEFGDNLCIGEVAHKTFISVDELGTKAGAATAVIMATKATMMRSVVLNRPFVYAIIDDATSIPVFIGVLRSTE